LEQEAELTLHAGWLPGEAELLIEFAWCRNSVSVGIAATPESVAPRSAPASQRLADVNVQ
jgi:hypothetical protein